ncbi:hypothetical protein VTJ49DRAFT_2686 [Mycothermus thermophilus]|uniref:Geranylgeranyl pyrophosphate synthetase n=1 Tax=Humicola insolens TaxID=85995 RepID=A0ABR3V9M6_HUMIN
MIHWAVLNGESVGGCSSSLRQDMWSSAGPKFRQEDKVTPSPAPPLGNLLNTLRVDDLEPSAKGYLASSRIENARTVTSYSWVDNANSGPTILIPGKPPLWTPQKHPAPLKEDRGTYYRDKNAARYPKHPIEPAAVALLRADPSVPTDVDVFACGSTLGNLLRFVRGQDKSFRMLAYLVKDTVFLVRRENSPTELIPDVRGFGHSFPEANTTWERDVRGSVSNQRLIRYTFGGLDMVVRFEADGYIQSPAAPASKPSPVTPKADTTDSDLITSLATTSISTPAPTTESASSEPHRLTIKPAGSRVPQSAIFDLKTRSIYTRLKRDHLAEELPRLWVSQIPTFILAFHTRGLFKKEDTEIKDVRQDVQNWEAEHKNELASLVALLHRIRDILKGQPGQKVELVHSGDGTLEVREQLEDAGEVMSDAVRGQWEASGEERKEAGDKDRDQDSRSTHDQEDNDHEDDEEDAEGGIKLTWDDGEEEDYTACTADSCGYCGRCSY